MIPRVAHFFWANESMSLMRFLTLASFRHWNPTWRMKLHRPTHPCQLRSWETPERQEFGGDAAKENWLDKVESLDVELCEWTPPRDDLPVVHASDLFAWHILATEGGLYCDMDVLFIKSLADGLGEDKLTRDSWLCFYHDVFPIGFLASNPDNPFFRDVFDWAVTRPTAKYQSLGCEAGTAVIHRLPEFIDGGVAMLPKCRHAAIQMHYNQKVLLLNQRVVYPWGPESLHCVLQERRPNLSKYTVGIHWYGGHPMAQEVNAIMTRKRMSIVRSTYTLFARKIELP